MELLRILRFSDPSCFRSNKLFLKLYLLPVNQGTRVPPNPCWGEGRGEHQLEAAGASVGLLGPSQSAPRLERLPVEGKVSRAESEAGQAGWTGKHSCVCHLEQPALPQSGRASRHLPLGTQASLFPARRADTPAPQGKQAGVFVTDKYSPDGAGPPGLLAQPLFSCQGGCSHLGPGHCLIGERARMNTNANLGVWEVCVASRGEVPPVCRGEPPHDTPFCLCCLAVGR